MVVGGFLGVSSDQHVLMKLGKENTIKLSHRVAMCERVTSSHEWVVTVPWGWANSHRIAQKISRMAKNRLPKGMQIKDYQVWGADHCCRYLDSYSVCALRPPYTNSVRAKARKETIPEGWYMTRKELNPVSSTEIRKYTHEQNWETLSASKAVAPVVGEYLRKKHAEIWAQNSQCTVRSLSHTAY